MSQAGTDGMPVTEVFSDKFDRAGDIILRSSDGVLFQVYRKDLAYHSDGFPDPGMVTSGDLNEYVALEEPKDVLELLLQFMRKQAPPDLRQINLKSLLDLATAAEKYQVFHAMTSCRYEVERKVNAGASLAFSDRVLLLDYAFRNNERELANMIAPLTLSSSPISSISGVLRTIGVATLQAWLLYQEACNDAIVSCFLSTFSNPVYHKGGVTSNATCMWEEFQRRMANELFQRTDSVTAIVEGAYASAFRLLHDCHWCRRRAEQFKQTLDYKLSSLPPFSSYMRNVESN